MKVHKTFLTFFILLFPILVSCIEQQHEVYIVHLGSHKGEKALQEIEDHHVSYLESLKETKEKARDSLVYSYKHSINGFAALLTPDEASRLSELEEVISVQKSVPKKLHTTRSWNFLGLGDLADTYNQRSYDPFRFGRELLQKAKYGQDIIVGAIDSGVWPESKSFSDEGMLPIPSSWKGICQTGDAFNSTHCNRKIIGARYYVKGFIWHDRRPNPGDDFISPRDPNGHGTHTASTVAGRRVHDVTGLGGIGRGTATGGAPLARLAVYKACWSTPNQEKVQGNSCYDVDAIAAVDDAIADGVDVITMSIGWLDKKPFLQDGLSLALLEAVRNNIAVVCSAGNDGPTPQTATNVAPWIMTVGASSIDRRFSQTLVLGNGIYIEGPSITPSAMKTQQPLVYAADVADYNVPPNAAANCEPNTLSPELVRGKIVLCRTGGMYAKEGVEVKRAGGVGIIIGNNPELGDNLNIWMNVLPSITISADNTNLVINYIRSTYLPTASIQPVQTILGYEPAPFMALFSSQGPNPIDPYILKPDITAPGEYILAAWSGANPVAQIKEDTRFVEYAFDSGTSMSCPHVAAATVLLKAIHPHWSPAAIKSALMTTTTVRDNMNNLIEDGSGGIATPYQYGSGHFRPIVAADPGLVYDLSYNDYLLYLCNFNSRHDNSRSLICPSNPYKIPSPINLNYPSIAIPRFTYPVTIRRTVTNVDDTNNGRSIYYFDVDPPPGLYVSAAPRRLFFNRVGQKRSFTIQVSPRWDSFYEAKSQYKFVFGSYTWSDGVHNVSSPIVVGLR